MKGRSMHNSVYALLALTASALLACKMLDKKEPTATAPSAAVSASATPAPDSRFAASGVWSGAFKSPKWTGTVIGVITEDGRARFVSSGDVQIVGRFNVTGSQVSGKLASYAAHKKGGDFDIQGKVVPRTSLSGSYSGGSDTGTFQLAYGKEYERKADLASVADKWGGPGFGMTVDSAGKLAGKDATGCDYTGQFSVIDPSYNAYEIKVDVSGCRYKGSYDGMAFLTDNKATDDRLAVGINGERYAYAGYLQRGQARR